MSKNKGFFGKIFQSLKKTKDGISQKLAALFSGNKLGEDFFEELEEVLISSDMSINTAMEIVEFLREKIAAEKTKDKEYVESLLKQKLVEILTSVDTLQIKFPCVLMLIGVNGVGKTTTIGKLANVFSQQNKSVVLAAADTFRAAASQQLSEWAQRAKVKIISQSEGSDPSAVVFDALASAKAKGVDVAIIDTAGRLHNKTNLMQELQKMSKIAGTKYPEATLYKLIVLDATTGHNALNQVKAFDESIGVDGIVLTKLDGTAKAGFVVSLAAELKIPVVYVGTGEEIGDVSEFDAKEFAEGMI